LGIASLLGVAAFVRRLGHRGLLLTSISLLPSLVSSGDCTLQCAPRARTRHRDLAAPVTAGLLAQHLRRRGAWAGRTRAALALACILALPKAPAPQAGAEAAVPLVCHPGRCARFVVRHDLLRGISLAPSFWNFAFFGPARGLGAVGAGSARPRSGAHGLAQSAYGAGLILGALVAPVSSRRLPPLAT